MHSAVQTTGEDGLEEPMPGAVPPTQAAWDLVGSWLAEDLAVSAARLRGEDLGCLSPSAATGALLRLLAATRQARAVVEVGTGVGVTGAWLLAGMAAEGVLTTIDMEADHQRAARETFEGLGVPHARVRMILGRAPEVLPRLTDEAYDMVVLDTEPTDLPAIVPEAARLLRDGGLLVIINALDGGRVADPNHRDVGTQARRDLTGMLRSSEGFVPALLTVGEGALVAARRR